MIRKLKIISFFLLSSVCSKAQDSLKGDSVLRAYFTDQKYDYPVNYSRIESLNYNIEQSSSEKIISSGLILLRKEDRQSVKFGLDEISKRIIDTLKYLDKDDKNACVYYAPEISFNTFYRCYIIRVDKVNFVYSDSSALCLKNGQDALDIKTFTLKQ